MSNYKNCTAHIYSTTYYLVDENGHAIRNEDGTTKLFYAKERVDTSTWVERVEPEMLEEVDDALWKLWWTMLRDV